VRTELFTPFFVEKIRASITRPCSLVQMKVPFSHEFRQLYSVSDAEIVKLVKSKKRSSSPADPISVTFLRLIIDCIGQCRTQAINSSLLSKLVSSAFKAAIVRPI